MYEYAPDRYQTFVRNPVVLAAITFVACVLLSLLIWLHIRIYGAVEQTIAIGNGRTCLTRTMLHSDQQAERLGQHDAVSVAFPRSCFE